MFLMNTSPLVALQRKWEPFPQPRNCRYPVCFSESEEDLARTAVNAKVQMIINNLQSEEVTLDASSKYGCIVQKKQKAAKDRGPKFRRNDLLLQEHINYTLRNYPTDSDGMDMEESAEFGPLTLNSDSDDSVDRDIEEAIQEHLRNKSQNLPPLPNNPKNVSSKDEDQPVQQKFPSRDAACHLFPVACGPVSLAHPYVVPGQVEDNVVQWASSPCSMSSDDSFEQSIKAEIEQFLKKKKQQERKKITRRNKPFHQKEELQEKLALSQKSSANRRNQSPLKQGGKACFSKRHPELQSISPAKCLKSKTSEETAACKTERQTDFSSPAVCDSFLLEESEKNGKRQRLCNAGREERVGCTDVSDSSSDDGIEEAIQRYQLEKIKKAAESRAGCVSLQKEGFSTSKAENILPSLTSALPEITPKAQSCRRKDASTKAAAINRPGTPWNHLRKSRIYSPPENTFAKCSVTLQASCRADTAAELMCAEAILDISKTILPLPTASDNKLFSTSPSFPSQNMLPSQYESDNNIVDSDDSIEQEIRAFLAVKAKTERLIAKSTFQVPLSLGQSSERTQSSKRTFPKCLKLPLNHKKKFKRKLEIMPQNEDAQLIFSEMDYVDKNLPKSSVTQLKNERTGKMVIYPKDTQPPINSIGLPCPLSHTSHNSRSPLESITQGPQKHGADDKSSSFDSDEDLDTAIKDLLRSKRKLKKKSKDQRIHCKNKVQLGDAEMHVFYKNERDRPSQTPTVLKKCIVSARRDIREGNVKKGPLRKPKTTTELKPECKKEYQTKPVSGAEIQEPPKTHPCLWAVTSLADESSSIDSDDSIEEEIQRFLAEKAKASARIGGLPDATGVAGTLGADKPQAALLKAGWQLLKRGSPASEKECQKVGKVDLPVAELSSRRRYTGESEGKASPPSEQARSLMEDGGSQASVENPPTADPKGIELPERRAAAQRKDIWEDRIDQRTLSSAKGKAECGKWQNYFKTTPSFKRKRSPGFETSSKCLADLRGGGNKRKSELLGKRQDINFSLLKEHGRTLAANLFGGRSLPKEIVGSKSEAGVREADQDPRSQAGSLHPCSQERDGSAQEMTITTEVVNLVKHNRVESHEGDASQRLPLQGSGVEETTISPGAACVEDTVRKGGVLEYSPSCSKCEVPEGPCDLSVKGKGISQGRTAEEQAQKLLEGGSAEVGQWGHTSPVS
ncbi:protein phosphatase 1 regulatory subunit 26 [Protobothrops mucrosquamatus]|uniref:protein phosphatase 1 regulatory subunit 26 n=1 Tax=Protobothrops mucrosquamatus TaxID=103944 RepID=UPI000775E90C|nr:protein phosphatase 1 regulatory subunit 26 [Protobothrops mucrosquamatus]